MLLSVCLVIIRTREKAPIDTYRKVFEEGRAVLVKPSSTDVILGSLLAFKAITENQEIVRWFLSRYFNLCSMPQSMAEYYKSMCELTFKYRDSKEVALRKASITLTPNLAKYDSEQFEIHFLRETMLYLLNALGRPTDRDFGMPLRATKLTAAQHM